MTYKRFTWETRLAAYMTGGWRVRRTTRALSRPMVRKMERPRRCVRVDVWMEYVVLGLLLLGVL